ncbi:MAG: hypothetical protein ACK47B_07735 [Armatimonadota bacterium]
MTSCQVEVRILAPGTHAESIQERLGDSVKWDGADMVYRSRLIDVASASDHLKWLYGVLEPHRKFFRQLEGFGITAVIRIEIHSRSCVLEPEALLLAHQFHLRTEIHLRR